MIRLGRSPRHQLAGIALLLGAMPCLAQAVTVSVKVHIADAALEHKYPIKPIAGMSSGDVVVWLTPADATVLPPPHPAPAQGYRLVQKNKQFSPHLLVVPTGSNIDFPNEDPFFHNVFSLFNGKRFDLGLYEAGSHRSVRFDREGISYIFCNIHPEMGAVVVSLHTPYYAVSSGEGSVSIADVPPGEYSLKVWAEGVPASDLAGAARKVTISRESVMLSPISLLRSASPAEHKNKFGEDYKPTSTKPY